MPVLPWRDQPQHPDAPLSLGHDRRQWPATEPVLPPPAWALGEGGRPGEYCRRDIVDGIRYLVKEGIQWRAMPVDSPAPVYRVRVR